MDWKNLSLSVSLSIMGLTFLVFALIFRVKKEKACKLIGGFNFMTEEQQARYDRPSIAKDYEKLFWRLTAVVFAGAALSPFLGWWAFGGAMAGFFFLIFRDFHFDPEKAFAKYKLRP